MRNPTAKKFLAETTLDLPVAGKTPLVNLAGPIGVSLGGRRRPKAGMEGLNEAIILTAFCIDFAIDQTAMK